MVLSQSSIMCVRTLPELAELCDKSLSIYKYSAPYAFDLLS
jgi:hypothetical protein